ncbi:MAG: APC family permease [Francisellaceae bacterium]
MSNQKNLSALQLTLLSCGGMIGTGWLFSPYYGFQAAGVWVMLSWLITAFLIFIIALCFAEVASNFPIGGSFLRYLNLTHSKGLGFLIITIGWLSYVVYLPLEAQGTMQYLGFWFPALIKEKAHSITLSNWGLLCSLLLMLGITLFNTLHIKKIAITNVGISLWKILLPVLAAIFVMYYYAKPQIFMHHYLSQAFDLKSILLAITTSGIAFAFTGFQNGLILANNAKNVKRAIPLSVIAPIIIGLLMYGLLSLLFIFCLPETAQFLTLAAAPLLGILGLLGMHCLLLLMFADSVISPLGTANVYTAVTARILSTSGYIFTLNFLKKMNKVGTPINCLWVNFFIGTFFLLPLPTWKQLVTFLSSLVMLGCLSGPISLLVLRKTMVEKKKIFRLPFPHFFAYSGFISCSLFIYWSGTLNLIYITLLTLLLMMIYQLFLSSRYGRIRMDSILFLLYVAILSLISLSGKWGLTPFPYDQLLLLPASCIFMYFFTSTHLSAAKIRNNFKRLDSNA